MENNYTISAVIVTFNRKDLLKRCLEAINGQTYKAAHVYIMDNASTDGTMDSVKEWGFYQTTLGDTQWHYILNDKNEGGAGGFYKGMKTAFEETKPDALWVMDDDGQPDKDCLKNLAEYLAVKDYIAPIVLSDEDHIRCSFAPNYETCEEFAKIKGAHDGIIDNWSSPFNGILYSARLIKTIGYPKKELFIWGDEINYHYRCLKAGFMPISVLAAVHYHPLNRQIYIEFRNSTVIDIQQDWKLYCYLRNSFYNRTRLMPRKLKGVVGCMLTCRLYYKYFKEKYNTNKLPVIIDAYFAGILGWFGGLRKYMK